MYHGLEALNVGEAARGKATYEDLLKVPDNLIAEIIDGDLHASPRPSPIHQNATSAIGGALFDRYHRGPDGPDRPGGWWIIDEPELHLRDDILVPDLAGWRRERLPALPREHAYFALAPDWVCEVLSPSTARIDRVQKRHIYARNQVRHLWLVDPDAQTLEVLRLAGDFWQEAGAYAADDKVHAEPFVEVELDLARWWVE